MARHTRIEQMKCSEIHLFTGSGDDDKNTLLGNNGSLYLVQHKALPNGTHGDDINFSQYRDVQSHFSSYMDISVG
jgi:hypothetical protein